MKANPLMNFLLERLRGSRVRREKHGEVRCGDVIAAAGGGLLKRYAIWAGGSVIRYGKDKEGRRCVHEAAFGEFLQGADQFTICRFPKKIRPPHGMGAASRRWRHRQARQR